MHKNRIFVTFLSLFAINVFCVSSLWANSISISDLGVDNAAGAVSVGFSIVVNDVAPLLGALQNGGEYTVQCTSKLYHRRAGFWDSFLSEAEYTCVLSSKPIARECLVRDQRGTHSIEFSELQSELNRFWSRISVPMGTWEMIERGSAYRVVLAFKITRTNIPGWVSKPLFFVSWELVPEVVYELDFDF